MNAATITMQYTAPWFYVSLSRDQAAARGQVKAAGLRFHWGPERGDWCRSGRCPQCKAGVPAFAWTTRDPSVAAKLRDYATPAAAAAIQAYLQADQASRATSVEQTAAGSAAVEVPCPEGRAFRPYQLAGIQWLLSHERAILGDEPGLGKTAQVVGLVNADPTIRRVLVVCPASLRINWGREVQMWQTRGLPVVVVDSIDDLPHRDEAVVAITNYDLLVKGKGKGSLGKLSGQDLATALLTQSWDVLALDEAHKCKAAKAQRTRTVYGGGNGRGKPRSPGLVDKARRVVIMTGTPITNRPKDLHTALAACSPRFRNFIWYAERYCEGYRDRWGFHADGASHLDELQRRLRTENGGIMVRRLKADVLTELPAKVRQVVPLAPNGAAKLIKAQLDRWEAQREAQDLARAQAAVAKSRGDRAAYEAAVERLQEAAKVAFEEMARERHDIAMTKVPAVVEHCTDHLESLPKLVVFAHHKDVVQALAKGLADFGPRVIQGDTPQVERQAAVDAFQDLNSSCRVIIGNIQAMGTGLTLTAAHHVVFAELDWTPANMSQAEDRCHRLGQRECVTVEHMVYDGSLDQRMAELLVEKQGWADAALDTQADTSKVELDATETRPQWVIDRERRLAEREAAKAERKRAHQDSVARGKAAGSTATWTDEQRALALAAVQALAAVCDGARSKDDKGFSASWVSTGHYLAGLSTLDDGLCSAAVSALQYHKRQVDDATLAALGLAEVAA